jgi:signal transduction histidine kinase
MRRNRLFNRPRLQLAIAYSTVMGRILIVLGLASHTVLQRAFDRMTDRELHLLADILHSRLETNLRTPGQLPDEAQRLIPELCLPGQPCPLSQPASTLRDLIQSGYHLQLLDVRGQPLAAIAEAPDSFPANPQLIAAQTVQNKSGQSFHLHLIPLKTVQGDRWGYLQVGKSVERLDEYMQNFHWLLLVGIPTTMGAIALISWSLAGLAMQPIYQAYGRMQQFTADIAHEFKTPLAAAQAIVETRAITAG